MYADSFLTKLVTTPNPLEHILDWLVARLEPLMHLDQISTSYNRVEEELVDFELWLHKVWGPDFYKELLGSEETWAIPRAFKTAIEVEGNILICDGWSLRELLVLRKALPGRMKFTAGKTPAPTTTQNVIRKIFNSPGLKEAFTGVKLYWGKRWKGSIIEDISNPPRPGRQKGLMFLTYYPDAPLHDAVKYGVTQVQDVSKVITQLINIIRGLSSSSPLVVTGDHGYIYLGDNPNKFMWLPFRRQERYGVEYGDNYVEVDEVKTAVGRFVAPVSRRSKAIIVHGGVSLSESLVPVAVIEAEAH